MIPQLVGLGLGLGTSIYGAVRANEAAKKREELMRRAQTYQGSAKPRETEALAEANLKGLGQEAEAYNEAAELNTQRAIDKAEKTASSTSSILSAISNAQASENEAKRNIARDIMQMKDRRMNALAQAKEEVASDDKAIFEDAKQKQAALIEAENERQSLGESLALKGVDLATAGLMSTVGEIEANKKKKK